MKKNIVHKCTEVPATMPVRARDTIWAKEAGRDWADQHAAKPFQYDRANPEELAAATKGGTWGDVAQEGDRVDAVKRGGLAPVEVGPEVVLIAPARGPVIASRPVDFVPEGATGFKMVDAGYRGRSNMRQEDVFDRMCDQARRRDAEADAPFTKAQINTGREYRALYEWVQAAGVKCSSIGRDGAGGGGRVEFMDIYAQQLARLRWADRQIGTGIAKEVRRVRPSKAGRVTIDEGALRKIGRVLITRKDLIQMVCIADKSLSDVLRAHHWSVSGKNPETLRRALCAILDDLSGI
jgi:hypothetical protein